MSQECWGIWADRGFLIAPDPVQKVSTRIGEQFPDLVEALEEVETLAASLPELLETGRVRSALDVLHPHELTRLKEAAPLDLERVWQMYTYFGNAYVHGVPNHAVNHLPPGVAVPLVTLSRFVERPPILSYSDYVLKNWRKIDPDGEIAVDNLELIQEFLGNRDERWFILIHVDIEARAAGALMAIKDAAAAVRADSLEGVQAALEGVSSSIRQMMKTFARMPEQCDSDVYYFNVRPYIFGFTDIVYQGVAEYSGQPQSFRGQTGAQSSIIPALVAAFGLAHEQNDLTHHLNIMQSYMPRPHREFIQHLQNSGIREFVIRTDSAPLRELYNHSLRSVMEFRKLHYHYATTYIFKKVENPLGTGGTVFMDWLNKLISETEAQMV